MIQTQAKRELIIEDIGETTKMRLSKSAEVEAHIVKILTENYRFPIESHVREAVSNHLDSHVENGNPESPIFVKLYKNPTGNYTFETSDTGLGLSEEEFYKYYMQVGESSKRGKANLIGGKGCGAKAILSYSDSYEVICRKNGEENRFLVFKGELYPESTLLSKTQTTEPNGVVVRIPVDRWDFTKFTDAIKEQLAYFPSCYYQIEDNFDYNNIKIFENDLFKWSEMYSDNELHIAFGVCRYSIDWKLLGISPIYLPVAIKIPIDCGIDVQFNRESLTYDKFAKEYIKNKIVEISTWFINKYNENTPDERELLEAWSSINDTDKYVELADEKFKINDLIKYSSVAPKDLKIKGITLKEPKFYKNHSCDFSDEYECLVDYSDNYNRKWRTKYVKSKTNLVDRDIKHILVNRVPTGKLKQFLLDKHNGKLKFIKKIAKRSLGGKYISIDSISYKNILNLVMEPKNTWRGLIQEWQFVENQFKSLIVDETNCESTIEYLQWLAKEKKIAKINRKSSSYRSSSNYVRINKQEGDITLQIACKKEIGDGCKFVKKAVKITDLNRLHKSTKALHIYFSEDQKERAKEFYDLLGVRYSICVLSPRELKRLQEIKQKQFMTEESFITSKPFCKIMSSLKYEKAIDNFDEIYRNSQVEIIDNVLGKFKEQREILKKYVRENGKDVPNNLLDSLKEIAELKGLYDHSLNDVYSEFVKNTEKYSFLTCLKKPSSWETEELVKYRKLINSLLLMKQKYSNFEELEIEVKEKQILEPELETV
jgi:hypothetical protein